MGQHQIKVPKFVHVLVDRRGFWRRLQANAIAQPGNARIHGRVSGGIGRPTGASRAAPPRHGPRAPEGARTQGGSSDAMTLAIAHREKDVAVLDCVRGRRTPFSPDDCVRESSDVLRTYGIAETRGPLFRRVVSGAVPHASDHVSGIRSDQKRFVLIDAARDQFEACGPARQRAADFAAGRP
jgi:hypothetical protein